MRLVIDNPDIERKRTLGPVIWSARRLAANLMRVVRGAGQPAEIARDASVFLDACDEYRQKVGHYPLSDDLAEALNLESDQDWESRATLPREEREWEMAKRKLLRGALQAAASGLLQQRTQISRGETEMFDGVRMLEDQRERNRRSLEIDMDEEARGRAALRKLREKKKLARKPKR